MTHAQIAIILLFKCVHWRIFIKLSDEVFNWSFECVVPNKKERKLIKIRQQEAHQAKHTHITKLICRLSTFYQWRHGYYEHYTTYSRINDCLFILFLVESLPITWIYKTMEMHTITFTRHISTCLFLSYKYIFSFHLSSFSIHIVCLCGVCGLFFHLCTTKNVIYDCKYGESTGGQNEAKHKKIIRRKARATCVQYV